jgi:hypothetical protein
MTTTLRLALEGAAAKGEESNFLHADGTPVHRTDYRFAVDPNGTIGALADLPFFLDAGWIWQRGSEMGTGNAALEIAYTPPNASAPAISQRLTIPFGTRSCFHPFQELSDEFKGILLEKGGVLEVVGYPEQINPKHPPLSNRAGGVKNDGSGALTAPVELGSARFTIVDTALIRESQFEAVIRPVSKGRG